MAQNSTNTQFHLRHPALFPRYFWRSIFALMGTLPRRATQQISQWQTKNPIVKSIFHALTRPITAWTIFVIPFWLWHLPAFYQAALQNNFIHYLEHACLLQTAYFFWWVVLQHHRRMQFGVNMVLFFMTMMQGAVLGMLLVFSSRPWYDFYSDVSDRWGLTPLHDQQLSGLVMWDVADRRNLLHFNVSYIYMEMVEKDGSSLLSLNTL